MVSSMLRQYLASFRQCAVLFLFGWGAVLCHFVTCERCFLRCERVLSVPSLLVIYGYSSLAEAFSIISASLLRLFYGTSGSFSAAKGGYPASFGTLEGRVVADRGRYSSVFAVFRKRLRQFLQPCDGSYRVLQERLRELFGWLSAVFRNLEEPVVSGSISAGCVFDSFVV